MEGKNDHDSGHDRGGGDLSLPSLPSPEAGASRSTPPAQRFASLGDAHLAITTGRRATSGSSTNTNGDHDSRNVHDMPNSSSGFNPALMTGLDGTADEPDDTTLGRIVDQYLPSGAGNTTQSSILVTSTTTTSSGFNPALRREYLASIQPAASTQPVTQTVAQLAAPTETAAPSSSRNNRAQNSHRGRAFDSNPFNNDPDDEDDDYHSVYSTDGYLASNANATIPIGGSTSLSRPPQAALPQTPGTDERNPFTAGDVRYSTTPSLPSFGNSQDLLRTPQGRDQNAGELNTSDHGDPGHGENLAVAPLTLRANNPNFQLGAISIPNTDRHPFQEPFDAVSNSGLSNSDSQEDPFVYDNDPYRLFLSCSVETSISQNLHNTSNIASNVTQGAHINEGRVSSAQQRGSAPPLPPLSSRRFRHEQTHTNLAPSAVVNESDATEVRVTIPGRGPIQSLRTYSQARDAAEYIREHTAEHDNYFTPGSEIGESDGGDWVTEPTTGGFNSNRAFASSNLHSPLQHIGLHAGSSLANNSDAGYDIDVQPDAFMGTELHTYASNERILPANSPVPSSPRYRHRRSDARVIGRPSQSVVFEPRARLHRVNGVLQNFARTMQNRPARDSGPFGAASRAFTSDTSPYQHPYANLERSTKYDFHDDHSNAGDLEANNRLPAGESDRANDGLYSITDPGRNNRDWTSYPLADPTVDTDQGLNPISSILTENPLTPVRLDCELIEREEYMRRQAVLRASGEQTDSVIYAGRKKVAPPPSAFFRKHELGLALPNPFEPDESVMSRPVNAAAESFEEIELTDLSRKERDNHPYRSQVRPPKSAPPIPAVLPTGQDHYWLCPQPQHLVAITSSQPRFVGEKRRIWYTWMMVGSTIIPFFFLLAFTYTHNDALAYYTSGHVRKLDSAERRFLVKMGVANILFIAIMALTFALLGHYHVI